MSLGNAYLFRIPTGIPGVLSRVDVGETIEPGIMDPNTPVTAFGVFVKKVSGKVQPIAATDAASVIQGLLVKPYPISEPSVNEAFLAGTPDPSTPANVLKRGYMTVSIGFGTAADGGQVYVCNNVAGGHAIGEIGDNSDAANCVVVAGCYFKGAADSNGVTEIAYNL